MTEWRAVVGYEPFYEVSDGGEVKSLARRVGAKHGKTRVRKPHALAPFCDRGGYWAVRLTDAFGIEKHKRVHHVVAAAFLGERPSGLLVLHSDDDRSNNSVSNLYYGTHKQNAADRSANGKWKPGVSLGEHHGQSKLKEKDIPRILEMRDAGVSGARIARRFGVASMTIHDILRGKNWSWLTGIGSP